jgi:hypothetical protein
VVENIVEVATEKVTTVNTQSQKNVYGTAIATTTGTALQTNVVTEVYTVTSTNPADDYRGAAFAVLVGTQSQVDGSIVTPGSTGANAAAAGVPLYEVSKQRQVNQDTVVEVDVEYEIDTVTVEEVTVPVDVIEETTYTVGVPGTSTVPDS